MTPPDTDSVAESWTDTNDRALGLALAADWEAAAELWATALSHAPTFALEPDTHALLLSNLAQARFRCGDINGALELGHRSLAARLLCCDSERDAPISRAQSDLSVYLAAAGHTDEAAALLEQARESLESRFGDENDRLISVLENQARLALLTDHPAIAEPLLLRLHALLDALGDDPSRVESLLARVAASRGASNARDGSYARSVENSDAAHVGAQFSAHADAHADTRFDDHSDAHADSPVEFVEQQVRLATPATRIDPITPAVTAAVVNPVAPSTPAREPSKFPQFMDDEFDLIDDATHTPMSSPSAQSIRSEGLIEPGTHPTPSWSAKTNPLGFEVQYGVPADDSYAAPPHTLHDR